MSLSEILETIMTMHWDMMRCRCWVCVAAREHGLRPRPEYAAMGEKHWRGRVEYVNVEWPQREPASAPGRAE